MVSTTPLVTVLIPAYNAAVTIERALSSALMQTYRHTEIVVVDDGSRDATSDIVATQRGDNIRLIRLAANQGASAAMNAGIAVARGELIAFLDADDQWLPTKLARQVEILQRNAKAVMVSCGCRFVDAGGQVFREFGMPPRGIAKADIWRELLAATFIAKPCVVARANALRAVGPFDVNLPVGEDQDMWIRLAMSGEVEFVPEFLTLAHDAPGSLTKVYAAKADKHVLPMIRRHIERRRNDLSRAETRRILGARYTSVGRNLYVNGSLFRGARLMGQAAIMGVQATENLWYVASASPPANAIKRLIRPSRKVARNHATSATAKRSVGSLLVPEHNDIVVLPSGPPILMIMIDAEAEFDWNGPFLRTHMSVRNLSQQAMAQDIFDRLNVRPTYLVDYAVATQPEGYEPLRDILQSGRCEIGAHLQPWENPPFIEDLSIRTSFNHNLPAWLQKEKLGRLTDAIMHTFRMQPIVYRAGRYGVGEETASILESLGYQVDLSVLPGHDLRRREGPDFSRAFNQPYWFGQDRKLLEIPLTTVFAGLLARSGEPQAFNASLYTALSRREAIRLHLPGVLARLGLLERITLTPEGMSIQELKRLTHILMRRGQRVFTFNYHSSALLPGSTPYVRSQVDLDCMLRTIEAYLHFFLDEIGGITMTPAEFRRACGGGAESLREHRAARPGP